MSICFLGDCENAIVLTAIASRQAAGSGRREIRINLFRLLNRENAVYRDPLANRLLAAGRPVNLDSIHFLRFTQTEIEGKGTLR